jgi:hypothetical protein
MSNRANPRARGLGRVGPWLLLAALALAAPLGAQSTRVTEDDPQITVQNNRDEAVTIYLRTGRFEQKLGIVEPMSTGTLALPWTIRGMETVDFLIQPKGDMALEAKAMISEQTPRLSLVLEEDGEPGLFVRNVSTSMHGTTVTVENDQDEAADVFILHESHQHLLGRVAGESTQTFHLPSHSDGEAGQILVAQVGGRTLFSRSLSLADTHVDVEID